MAGLCILWIFCPFEEQKACHEHLITPVLQKMYCLIGMVQNMAHILHSLYECFCSVT